jgi:Phosphotransferase system sorbitol-specific component IIC
MEIIAGLANGFMELFKAGAATFSSWVTGIIPLVVILMTAVSSVIKLIGEERVYKVAEKATQNIITRYTVLPILAVLFLGNPMSYTFGRFVDEKYKPAFYDANVSFLHPVTGLFPPERKIWGLRFSEIFIFSRFSIFLSPFNPFFRQFRLLLHTSEIMSCSKALSKFLAVFPSLFPAFKISINRIPVSLGYFSYLFWIFHSQSFDPEA